MARVLVTGAAGFVGANMVRALLARGDEVHACVHGNDAGWRLADIEKQITLHDLDMTSRESVDAAVALVKPEVVLHLAHYGGNRGQSDSTLIRRVIIDGTAYLYEACERLGSAVRIVNAGSSSEYGAQEDAMREDMMACPHTEYGMAKLWATLYGEHLRRQMQIPITTLRLFSVYGPYEAPTRFFPAVILSLLRSAPPTLSNPETVRDFVHVDDVAAAFLQALAKPAGVYNVGTGIETPLGDAVTLIQEALSSTVALTWGGDKGRGFDTASWRADTARARDVLGWQARVSLKEGIERDVAWFKEHQASYAK